MGQNILTFPSHLRIEMTQGCNRTCYSCPVSPKKSKWKFMSMETFALIISNIDDRVKRIELSMHGEPLLNPYIVFFIDMLRNKLPKVQISIISNVESIHDVNVLLQLFRMGLNFLHVDIYSKKTKERFLNLLRNNLPELKSHGIKSQWFVKGGINIWGYHGGKEKIILVSDESEGFNIIGKHIIRNIHTWAGNLPYDRWEYYGIKLEQFPMMKKCTEPMKCAPIDIHGRVSLCCADAAKSLIMGDLDKESMYDIWNGDTMKKVRYVLSNGRRDLIPACFFCNRPSFRVGLWPYTGRLFNKEKIRKEFLEKSYISPTLQDLFNRSKNELSKPFKK